MIATSCFSIYSDTLPPRKRPRALYDSTELLSENFFEPETPSRERVSSLKRRLSQLSESAQLHCLEKIRKRYLQEDKQEMRRGGQMALAYHLGLR